MRDHDFHGDFDNSPTIVTIPHAMEPTNPYPEELCSGGLQTDHPPSEPSSLLHASTTESSTKSRIQCVGCCKSLPAKKDPNYSKEVTRPCDSCVSPFCIACVRDIFLKACKDSSRMPPRRCTLIPIHKARQCLSAEEVALFKLKYEEWSTPRPFYCPVPTCSTFIPERLLPLRVNAEGKRTDSGVGMPTAQSFSCRSCATSICVE